MKNFVLIISVMFLALSFGMVAKADIIYPETDTMFIMDASGTPGDTVEVTIKMANPSYSVGGISHRIQYDETLLSIDTLFFVDRGRNLEYYSLNFSEPGIIWIAAISLEQNLIPRDEGPVIVLPFVINAAAPDTVTSIDFANIAFYNNAWTDSSGNILIIPNLEGGNITINSQTDIDSDPILADEFELSQNYPNPFNQETVISFNLPKSSEVDLVVYDLLGREVMILYSGRLEAGKKEVRWDGRSSKGDDLSSGVYYYRLLVVEEKTITKRMTLLK